MHRLFDLTGTLGDFGRIFQLFRFERGLFVDLGRRYRSLAIDKPRRLHDAPRHVFRRELF